MIIISNAGKFRAVQRYCCPSLVMKRKVNWTVLKRRKKKKKGHKHTIYYVHVYHGLDFFFSFITIFLVNFLIGESDFNIPAPFTRQPTRFENSVVGIYVRKRLHNVADSPSRFHRKTSMVLKYACRKNGLQVLVFFPTKLHLYRF